MKAIKYIEIKLQQVISKQTNSYNNKSGLKLRIGRPIRAYEALEFLSVASTFETKFTNNLSISKKRGKERMLKVIYQKHGKILVCL